MSDSKYSSEKDPYQEIRYTEEELVKKYEARLPPPSPNLRFSIQLIAHNEMPGEIATKNPRGNLAEWLYAVFNSIEYYKKTDESDGDVEILVNVNNDENEMFYNPITGEVEVGTKANYRSLLLLKNLNAYAKDEISLEEALAFIDWIEPETSSSVMSRGNLRLRSMFSNDNDAGESHHDNETYRTVYQFYKRLFKLGKEILNNGTQLHAIDCTHGEFIHEMNSGGRLVRFKDANQFVRRRLISAIGIHRLERVAKENSINPAKQVILMTDADVRYSRKFIKKVFEHFSNEQGTAFLVVPFRMVREARGKFQETTFPMTLDLLNVILLRTMKYCANKTSNGLINSVVTDKAIPSGLWSLPMHVINTLAFQEASQIPGLGQTGDDETIISALDRQARSKYFLDQPYMTIIDRVSEQSFLGREATRTDMFGRNGRYANLNHAPHVPLLSKLSFRVFINNINNKLALWRKEARSDLIYDISADRKLDSEKILKEPLLLLLLNMLQATITLLEDFLTEQEKALVNKYIFKPGRLYDEPELHTSETRFKQGAMQLSYIRWISIFREVAKGDPEEYPHLFAITEALPEEIRYL